MELEESKNKIKRKKFFTFAGTGLAGLFLVKLFPFNLLRKRNIKEVTIEISPLSVSRKKIGRKNA